MELFGLQYCTSSQAIGKSSQPLIAFTLCLLGFYKYDHIPLGLVNTPATFQRLMETCLDDLPLNWCLTYIDDIIVFSKTPKDHLVQLRAFCNKLKEAGTKIESKCKFFEKLLTYLGHRISEGGI